MTCPKCGAPMENGACPKCGYAGSEAVLDPRSEWESTLTVVMRIIVYILIWILSLSILGFGLYKLHYWRAAGVTGALYESGSVKMPELSRIQMPDGRDGHCVSFFGDDGDIIYIEELDERFMVVGGRADIEVADAAWFGSATTSSTAEISLTPILTKESGEKELLPVVAFSVEMPLSPLTIIQPTEDYVTTLSSSYEIQLNVVYGSTVLVGGEDVTSLMDRQGNITVNVAVYPHGENPISILVQTPNHLEVRKDLVFYRQKMDIDLELASSTEFKSALNAMTIRGAVDPTAQLSVLTACEPGSLKVDEKGSFEFVAKFDHYGNNTVTIRAAKDGIRDSVISFDVYYVPDISVYSRSAWKMDYQQVLYCWDIWEGRVFVCKGVVVDVLDDNPNILVMDVSGDESGQYLVIQNESDLPITESGGSYTIYADISGQADYHDRTYTRLIGRYAERTD